MVRIPLYEIRYVDVNLNYVTIYANKEYTLKRTLRDIEKDLDSRFVRVGRSMIINITCVQKVTKSSVYLLMEPYYLFLEKHMKLLIEQLLHMNR
ncbi:LytTR family DNA-binding domain-containing protein [Erysipelotrichaceae bacterium HCN-30851]